MLLRKSQILLKWVVCLGGLLVLCAGATSDPNSPVVLNPRAYWTSHDYLRGTVWFQPWVENEASAPQLTVDGVPAIGWSKDNPYWDSTQVADGIYTFVLTERNKTFEVKLLVLNQPAIHSGTLTEDETWTADKVHLVEYPVTVPAGVMLTIADGTVVKFFDNASLTVEEGGKLVLGNCVFTHFADDMAGGDTNGDGSNTAPRNGKYWIKVEGDVVKQGFQNAVRYAVSPFLQGNPTIHKDTLETDETWNAGTVHLVRGAVRVPAGVTLTITAGAVVKFFDNASLTVEEGGKLVLGKCIFTHLADDTVGGDTNWDGTNTTPQAGKYQINTEGEVVTQGFQNDVRYAVSPFLHDNPTIHKDTLETDETWNAGTVHLVRGAVRVPAGVTLTIAGGAVVKFFDNASLTVDEGGKLVLRGGTAGSPPIRYNFIHSDTPWWEQSEVTHNGGSAWRSGAIGNYGRTSVELHFQGPGTISFWWRTSSESGYDQLHFYLDGNEKASLSGERDWEQKSWKVSGDGEHTFKWEYTKDSSDSNGSDCGWVDEIVWTPAVPPVAPCVFTHLADDTVGGDTNWDGEASAPVDGKYELVSNGGKATTVGIQPDIRYAKKTGLVRQVRGEGIQEGTFLALAGQPVTVTAEYAGTLDGYQLRWLASAGEVRFDAVEGNPYQVVFTMPSQDVLVECVLQKIMSTSPWSAWGTVDTRTTFGGQLLNGTRCIARMAQKRDANAYVELTDRDGGFVGEISTENWNSAAVADGWYTATIYEGNKHYSATLAVRNDSDIAVHGGLLGANESWNADAVHIVQYIVRVPNGRTLSVAPNAIVKVCPGAGFIVDEGGKLVLGDGCVITDIADDSVGGDTNMDAAATSSPDDDDGTVFNLADENALESEGTPEIKVKAPVERTIALLPGWNATVFDFALDERSTAALQMLSAMELDPERMTYVRPEEFLPNRLYWFFVTRVVSITVKGRQEVEELPEEALTSWVPYGDAYGVVPEGYEIYEWKDGLFQRFDGTQFVPGHGYFLRKRE